MFPYVIFHGVVHVSAYRSNPASVLVRRKVYCVDTQVRKDIFSVGGDPTRFLLGYILLVISICDYSSHTFHDLILVLDKTLCAFYYRRGIHACVFGFDLKISFAAKRRNAVQKRKCFKLAVMLEIKLAELKVDHLHLGDIILPVFSFFLLDIPIIQLDNKVHEEKCCRRDQKKNQSCEKMPRKKLCQSTDRAGDHNDHAC